MRADTIRHVPALQPNKHAAKSLFLDALGEPASSNRRSSAGGLQTSYTLPGPPDAGPLARAGVHVVLLDERYERDPLPCQMRREYCELVLQEDESAGGVGHGAAVWCRDFLLDDGHLGNGSCCGVDEQLAAWCATPEAPGHTLWDAACDATSPAWGQTPLLLAPGASAPVAIGDTLFDQQAELWPWLVRESPVCEMLGPAQRRWLRRELAASNAALHIVASGSVPAGALGYQANEGLCSGDDWECYKPAQVNLLHTLAGAPTTGCVLIATGDFHYSDIKLVRPGGSERYSTTLRADGLERPLWQFMASGMTPETAHHSGTDCKGSYREDLVGLRPLGECSYYSRPGFGVIQIDWAERTVALQIHDASGGGVASDANGVRQEVVFSLDTCLPV